MSELNHEITRQFQQLQTLMHRMVFHGFTVDGRAARTPYRGQGKVLAVLRENPEISQKELGGLLDMSKQALAELLGKLEKSGYIAREPSEADRRSVIVKLLPKGEGAAAAMEGSGSDLARIFDCLDGEEQERLRDYLERVLRQCAEYFPGDGPEQRREHMEKFLDRHDHSFTHFDKGCQGK